MSVFGAKILITGASMCMMYLKNFKKKLTFLNIFIEHRVLNVQRVNKCLFIGKFCPLVATIV
ncbi:hypothetical protein GCM10011514_04530 [Emticicia aquatilis]|uniref:Uncharacterized protein n=1 Tax=Emticicia aquatilis TaxID=1537369 RepID=A0A917DKB1_9BACT|nr:hypothetical protein GCM10011514_04530 [Emticicia aquatilis]